MKRRILPMLALFASLTLASCGGNTKKSSSSPAPESSSAPISSVEPASSSVEEITSSVPEESSVEPQQEWTNNATYHWHLVDGKQEDKAKHDMQEVAPEDDNNVPEGGNKAKAATCAEPGVKVEICSVCGYRKESNLKQLDHEYPNDGAYEETKPATCAEAGTKERTCSVCGEKDEQSIAKLAHNWEEKSTVEASGEGVG